MCKNLLGVNTASRRIFYTSRQQPTWLLSSHHFCHMSEDQTLRWQVFKHNSNKQHQSVICCYLPYLPDPFCWSLKMFPLFSLAVKDHAKLCWYSVLVSQGSWYLQVASPTNPSGIKCTSTTSKLSLANSELRWKACQSRTCGERTKPHKVAKSDEHSQ